MIQELLYTSAPKGLKPGSRGFCTVLSTSGMPAPVATALESLSGYRPVFPPGDPQADRNPIVYSHIQMSLSGRRSHVLSRIADYGLDYSQRTNKLAHHLVIDPAGRPSAGPAWMLAHSGMMRDHWNGELKVVSGERQVPPGVAPLKICAAWKELTGDAGWAGVLAESFLKHPEQPAYIIFSPGMNLLALIEEAIALLPANRRWDVTFSTYFTKIPNGVTCNWRCLLADSPEAIESRRYVQSLRIDLTKPLPPAKGGTLVEAARTGKMPAHVDPDQVESSSSQMPPLPQSSNDSDRPIRIVQDRAAPPSIRGQAGAPPIRQPESRSRGFVKWGIGAVLLIGVIAGAGIYASKLKSPRPLQIAGKDGEEEPQPTKKGMVASESTESPEQEADGTLHPDENPHAHRENKNSQQMASNTNASNQNDQPTSPAMPVNGQPPAPADENGKKTDAKTKHPLEGSQKLAKSIYFWRNLEEGLKYNDPKEFLFDDIQISDVTIWCPTDSFDTIRAENQKVLQDIQKTKDWSPYLEVSSPSIDKQESKFSVTAKTLIPYESLCRFVFLVKVEKQDSPSIIVPYGIIRREIDVKDKFHINKLRFPVSIPASPEKWNLKLISLKFNGPAAEKNLIPLAQDIPLTWKEKKATGQISLKLQDLVQPENHINQDLQKIDENPVLINVSVAQTGQDSGQKSGVQVIVKVMLEDFQKSLRQYIHSDIDAATSLSLPVPQLSHMWSEDKNLITDEKLKIEIEQLRPKLITYKIENEEKKEDMQQQKINKQQIRKAADDQLARIDRIEKFSNFAKKLTKNLSSLQLGELQISQECQNDKKTEYLPIFVYSADEQSSQPAKK